MDEITFKVGDRIKVGLTECIILKKANMSGYWIVEQLPDESIFTAHECAMTKID